MTCCMTGTHFYPSSLKKKKYPLVTKNLGNIKRKRHERQKKRPRKKPNKGNKMINEAARRAAQDAQAHQKNKRPPTWQRVKKADLLLNREKEERWLYQAGFAH
jgi:hypothetical protein